MNSGVVHDTTIFNFKFGDSKAHFFKECWELNKQKKLSQGPNNNYVQSLLVNYKDKSTANNINMLFYPGFNEYDKIISMDLRFDYTGWAPWNKDLHSDKLLPAIKDTLLKWYPGNDFMEMQKKDSITLFVKVDGNRQITLYSEKDTRYVVALLEDLRIKLADKK